MTTDGAAPGPAETDAAAAQGSLDLKRYIRSIPDFPKPGILFYDIGSMLRHPGALAYAVDGLAALTRPYQPERIMAIESRGFIFGASVAHVLGVGFGMVRKQGKLPGSVVGHAYSLEYGEDMMEVSIDLIPDGLPVVLVDDLVATGGTAAASVELLRKVGADVRAAVFLIELDGLGGRDKLDLPVERVLTYSA
jgi:adenine phosphoribosyltransferase